MENLYASIAARTGGNIYIGVVGPVRTGKSTLIKRVMEQMVIPNIDEPYRKERAKDELPQSGSGRTIMTSEPKFVPEEAVEITPDGTTHLRVRMIDSVGYMVSGAVGSMEDGQPRMVATPWYDYEIPMTDAAELGTKKVMQEHCTIGIVVTTDGTVTDIPREDYVEAEYRAITDMQRTGKPFLVIVNSREPQGDSAKAVQKSIREAFGLEAMIADCQAMDDEDIGQMLQKLLLHFGVKEPEANHVDQLRKLVFSENPSAYHAFPGVVIGRRYDTLIKLEQLPPMQHEILNCPGETVLRELGIKVVCGEDLTDGCRVRVRGELILRSRREGDTVRLSGGTKTLKKLMIDRKIPAGQRNHIPVIADADGIVMVKDLCVDQNHLDGPNMVIRFETL